MDNWKQTIILSKPLPFISETGRRRIDFSIQRDPNKQKYFSGQSLLRNLHWNSFDKLYTSWSRSWTQILPGFNSCVVFSRISMQWCCVSSVFMGTSIKGRIAEMFGFLVWPWYFICYAVSIIAGWSVWKWCRREFRRYDQCLQWGREVFNACVRKWRCIGLQRWSVVWVFYISVLGCYTRFSSVGNWKIIIDC